jgi:hypothetical protein
MEIFWIGKIKLLRIVHPGFQGRMVNAAFSSRIRIFFEDMLLKLLEKQRVIVIIPQKRPTLVH